MPPSFLILALVWRSFSRGLLPVANVGTLWTEAFFSSSHSSRSLASLWKFTWAMAFSISPSRASAFFSTVPAASRMDLHLVSRGFARSLWRQDHENQIRSVLSTAMLVIKVKQNHSHSDFVPGEFCGFNTVLIYSDGCNAFQKFNLQPTDSTFFPIHVSERGLLGNAVRPA